MSAQSRIARSGRKIESRRLRLDRGYIGDEPVLEHPVLQYDVYAPEHLTIRGNELRSYSGG